METPAPGSFPPAGSPERPGWEFDFAQRLRSLTDRHAAAVAAGDARGQVRALVALANTAGNLTDYVAALDYLNQAQSLADAVSDASLAAEVVGQRMAVLIEMGDPSSALQPAQVAWEEARLGPDAMRRLMAANMLGCVLVELGRAQEGLPLLQAALEEFSRMPLAERRPNIQAQSLADLSHGLLAAGRAHEALDAARRGAAVAREEGYEPLVAHNLMHAGRCALRAGDADVAVAALQQACEAAHRMNLSSLHRQALYELAAAQAALGRHAQAYASQLAAIELERSSRREEAFRRGEFLRTRQEVERSQRDREASDRALFAVLPAPIATRVRAGERRIAEDHADVSVLFADLVGFTPLASRLEPRNLVRVLEDVFTRFDRLTAAEGLDKVKTIGDAYMVVGGALAPLDDHFARCARLAFGMLGAVRDVAHDTGIALAARVGLHRGPVVAGVLGEERLAYDLWGDTVNIAARLESSGEPDRVHVLAEAAAGLAPAFRSERRGPQVLKGVGLVETAFLAR